MDNQIISFKDLAKKRRERSRASREKAASNVRKFMDQLPEDAPAKAISAKIIKRLLKEKQ